ncbi:MAG: glutathione metabolism protein [Sneathiella sp.]|jgi:uncharacterized membrane protein YecN with MAPEG domain|uniref:MAPEG family protein n=1 Tax=Sneathiella sp. TaxID=1964365 RepID=UPI000C664EC1|nr:MAPEG family protein [Sneathiella sp.]MAL79983.1 glutathione metabolism protein [Sneathiella sp.]|tara:strand:+ start:75 stop:464 length:390 start_codon:yes stop_codon:yes gene_type:complete
MIVSITPFFAALLALVYVLLSLQVSRLRRKAQVSIGDGGDIALQKAIRAHGNFIEYVPITLIILMFLEMRTVSVYVIVILCALLLVGRILHAIGISGMKEILIFRMIGMICTFIALIVGSLWLLLTYLL